MLWRHAENVVAFIFESVLYKRADGHEINLLLDNGGELFDFDVAVADVEYV
ncbi:MAG: hypothetical protein IJY11_03180 [Clostridia bacterium]|nr:hypothetical protein [Clostridia bacterium]